MKEKIKNTVKNIKWSSVLISVIIIAVLLFIDQFSKYIIETKMHLYQSIPVIEGFFSITSHRNTGAAWGIAPGELSFFIIITIIALCVYILLYKDCDFKNYTIYSIALSLVFSGTLGNFIDRLFKDGKVTDFLDFNIFGYDFPIFNFADSCLVVGVALFAYDILFGKIGKTWKN